MPCCRHHRDAGGTLWNIIGPRHQANNPDNNGRDSAQHYHSQDNTEAVEDPGHKSSQGSRCHQPSVKIAKCSEIHTKLCKILRPE